MNILNRVALVGAALVATVTSASAGYHCVPEIDAGAGVSAIAMLAVATLISSQRRRSAR